MLVQLCQFCLAARLVENFKAVICDTDQTKCHSHLAKKDQQLDHNKRASPSYNAHEVRGVEMDSKAKA